MDGRERMVVRVDGGVGEGEWRWLAAGTLTNTPLHEHPTVPQGLPRTFILTLTLILTFAFSIILTLTNATFLNHPILPQFARLPPP